MSNRNKLQKLWKEAHVKKDRESIVQLWQLAEDIFEEDDPKFIEQLLEIRQKIVEKEYNKLYEDITDAHKSSFNYVLNESWYADNPHYEINWQDGNYANGEVIKYQLDGLMEELELSLTHWQEPIIARANKLFNDYAMDILPVPPIIE